VTPMTFTKMHGLGNDFIVARGTTAPAADVIASLADRHTGIGFDQLLWLEEPRTADTDIFYRIFNADGGEVEQCGNGARCIARYIAANSQETDRVWKLAFTGGVVDAVLQPDGDIAVTMGEPDFSPGSLPFIVDTEVDTEAETYVVDAGNDSVELAVVSMGNPHAVIAVDNIDVAPLERLGPLLEQHERFPNRANIGFMQVISPERIRLWVFERGVGETRACGTGACAAVVTGQRAGKLAEEVTVELPGGELRVRWAGSGTPVWLIGEAVTLFEGVVNL
jgi:diaminopimelate epimerase